MNSPRSLRALAGNLATLALLLAAAGLLLRLHLGEAWWLAAPLPARRWMAVAALLGYAVACFALWWRTRPPADDAGDADE